MASSPGTPFMAARHLLMPLSMLLSTTGLYSQVCDGLQVIFIHVKILYINVLLK